MILGGRTASKEMTEFIPLRIWRRFISKADASLGGGQGPGDKSWELG